ncbi:MAG: hypothetical protein ACPLIG_00880 [Candidatus Bathyarchaeales archaeon]
MNFPMNLSDISLWLAVMAIILLITSEIVSSITEPQIMIEKKRLRLVAIALGMGFMATVVMRIFQPF